VKRNKKQRASVAAAALLVYRTLGRDRRLVWVLGVLAMVSGFVDAVGLYLIARLATALTDESDNVVISIGPVQNVTLTVTQTLLWSAALVVFVSLLALPTAWISATLSERALMRSRSRLIDAFLGSPWSSRHNHAEGHLQHLVADFTPRVERFVLQLTVVIVNICGIVMAITAAVLSAPAAAAYFLAGLGIIGVAFLPLNRRMPVLSKRYLECNAEMARAAAQTSRLSQEVEVFNVGPALQRVLEAENTRSGTVLRRFRFLLILIPTSYQNAALAVVISVVALIRLGGAAQLAAMGPVLLLLVRALIYARQLQFAFQTAVEMTPYALRLDAEVDEMRSNRRPEQTARVGQLGAIQFDHVGYSYPGQPALIDDLDLEIPFGEVLGIAGPSGVGKTTLLQLLLRLRRPTEGEILINGLDLQSIETESWANTVGFVPQDNKLIRGSVMDNIAFYRETTPGQVEVAARRAHLWDDIASWPDGLDTDIGPGARDLSGGQKQRLGIARALLNKPQLLILDEPTSALDSTTESSVATTLHDLRGWTTVVVVAHRAETLGVCDRIIDLSEATADRLGSAAHV